MKISIIGANGFLSTAIARYANRAGWQLQMFGLEKPYSHQCDAFHLVNLMKEKLDCGLLMDSDMIIYASGAGIQANLKESKELVYKLNVFVPVEICNTLRELDYKGVFVSFGSVFEMGEVDECRKFDEKDVVNSQYRAPSEYVVSKRMLTRFVSSYTHGFAHWHFIIPTIYGPGENVKRLIPYTIQAILKHQPLQFTSGDQVRQYVYVDEVPRLLELAYDKNLASGVYGIEGNELMSVHQIVEMIHSYYHLQVSEDCFGKENRSDVGMKYLALDGTKLRNAIGFKAVVNIRDVIAQYEQVVS